MHQPQPRSITTLPISGTSRQMKMTRSSISWPLLLSLLTILVSLRHSHANPISEFFNIDQSQNESSRLCLWARPNHTQDLKLTSPILVAGVLCFVAASISSAGGIGGGGLFLPILIIVSGFDLKTASGFSAFMVTGGSIANVVCNMFIPSTKHGGKMMIDFDIALLSEPCILLGVSLGVICNLVFPEWLVTILFAVFLAWSTFKTCKAGVLYWNLESEEVMRNGCGQVENGFARNGAICDAREGIESAKLPLLEGEEKCRLGIPRNKLGILILIWFSFFVLYLLRGNKYGQTITLVEPCGIGYWILSLTQIPLAVVFTLWILYRRDGLHTEASIQQGVEGDGPSNKFIFPLMALLAGFLGGIFGIGGGMLISPLLLQVGVSPEVTAATCAFMVFFSSTMSAIQYFLLGMEHTYGAIIFAVICFVASFVGLKVVHRAIADHGRASLIVFSVGTVMALSTVLMTSFGAFDVWRNYVNGNYMGFKRPC